MDSLSIFFLIDSLFSTSIEPASEVNIRLAYTSSVTSAGRAFDISQQGISPGVSYYHKSGAYVDLAGYWNSGTDPKYNPTVLTAGYLGALKNSKWNYSLDAERWFYNPKDSSDNPLTYSIGGSLSYDFSIGFISFDYSFLFGKETAHRLIPSISGDINLGSWWIFDRVKLYPSVTMMAGNSDITQQRISNYQISDQTARRIQQLTSFASLDEKQRIYLQRLIWRSYNNEVITEQERNRLLFSLRNATNLSPEQIRSLNNIVNEGYEVYAYEDGNAFGILNYSFTLPLSLSAGNLHFLLSYTYSLPIQLPGEYLEVDPIGYFGASISYRIPFK